MSLLVSTLRPGATEVKIKITYTGSRPVLAVYNYQLKSSDTNAPIEQHEGDNQNSQDDIYKLPEPVESNKGRFVLIRSQVAAIDTDAAFTINIEVIQDGTTTEKLVNNGNVTTNGLAVPTLDKIKFQ